MGAERATGAAEDTCDAAPVVEAPAEPAEPEPVSTELPPDQPPKRGWWSKKGFL